MADNVIVTPSASYTVAAEDIGVSVEVQRVKVVLGVSGVDGGDIDVTNPVPVTGTVAVVAGLSVSAQVSGTVTVDAGLSVSAQVSGTVSVSGAVQISGVVSVSVLPAVSISVSAILGTVNTLLGTVAVNVVAGGAAPGTTAATQSAISAQVVWLAPTQTINATVNTIAAGFSVNALVTGPVSISAMPVVSMTGALISVVSTVLGTVAVNVVAGGAAPGTTAATQSAISAQVVWLAPTQTVNATVNTIAAGFSVNALVTGPVSISAMPVVSMTGALVSIVSTVLGTVAVTVVGGFSYTTANPSISATGAVVWIAGGQSSSADPVFVSGIVSVAGVSLGVVVSGPVSISAMPVVSMTGALVSVVSTVLGTAVVTVAGLKFTTATPTVTETGPVVWLANTVTVTVTATVTGSLIISGVTPQTGAVPGSAVSVGIPVWPGILPVAPVMIIVTSTAIAQSAAVYLFSMWTGAVGPAAAVATTAFAIPAGKTLRIMNIQAVVNSSAVTGGTVNIIVLAAGATASMNSASISTQFQALKLQVLVSAGPIAASIYHGRADVGAGTSIAVFIVASTASVLQQLAILGYLF